MATFLRKEPCPKCGSKDNLARYDDGSAHCFGGCGHYERADGKERSPIETEAKKHKAFLTGTPRGLDARGLRKETCEFWKYEIGEDDNGKPLHIANYFKANKKVAQKIRRAGKKFEVIGEGSDMLLYGQWLWPSEGKSVTIVEGEIDALSVSQVFNNKWPVVSLPKGAAAAASAIKGSLQWLAGFDKIVLMFDMDDPGQEAVAKVAPLLPAGKVYISKLPAKDANETLTVHGAEALSNAFWRASQWRPDGLVKTRDLKAKALKPVEVGLPWFLDTLTKYTFGRRYGEIYTLGAGTGVGKTDFLTQQITYDATTLNQKCALFFLEQEPDETLKRVAGKIKKRRFHIPAEAAGWKQEELEAALDQLDENDNVTFYDHFGCAEWDVIETHIRYLAVAEDVRIFYIDHLTALADPSKERESLELLMGALGKLVKELKIIVHLVSHLATPEKGDSHEEGGRVTIRQFKGSRSIGFWSPFMFGMERDQQADDPDEQRLTTFRILKDRYTGNSTGKVFFLDYDVETGMLKETTPQATQKSAFGGDPHQAL